MDGFGPSENVEKSVTPTPQRPHQFQVEVHPQLIPQIVRYLDSSQRDFWVSNPPETWKSLSILQIGFFCTLNKLCCVHKVQSHGLQIILSCLLHKSCHRCACEFILNLERPLVLLVDLLVDKKIHVGRSLVSSYTMVILFLLLFVHSIIV